MSPYVCDCTNVVYMFCVYCIYYYVNKFEARSLFSTSHLKCQQAFQSRDTAQTLVELCARRDGLSTCNALSYLDACELVNLISLD